jgi:AmiR/NasT family two-component response regulator
MVGSVEQDAPTRVLLGNLEPIVLIGMTRVLEEAGVEVIGHERHPSQIVTRAGQVRPDVVVLGRDGLESQRLAQRVRAASSTSIVILWARDERIMEVLDVDSSEFRVVDESVAKQLRKEIRGGSRHEQRVEE